ncbi:MAG: hypothetical protein V1827_01155 [Candidatus Micrarchaeota archaeon]
MVTPTHALKQHPEARCAMAGRFGKYLPEADSGVREAKPVSKPGLLELLDLFNNLPHDFDTISCAGPISTMMHRNYVRLLEILSQRRFDPSSVTEFSIALSRFQHVESFASKAGIFLSAMTALCDGGPVEIMTRHLDYPPEFLGFRNSHPCVIVHGDAGAYLGTEISQGSVIVEGDAIYMVGDFMSGGTIKAENVTSYKVPTFPDGYTFELILGRHMKGGEMHFTSVFPDLERGIRHVDFEKDRFVIRNTIEHGKIFIDGILIIDR